MNLNSLQFGMAQRIFLNGNPLTQASATNLAVPTYLNQEGINLDLTKPVGTNKALIQFDSFELAKLHQRACEAHPDKIDGAQPDPFLQLPGNLQDSLMAEENIEFTERHLINKKLN
jgi:hypothetical protein